MKKISIIVCALLLCLSSIFAACSGKRDENTLIVGASATPHAEILEFVKEDFEALGYKLEIVVYTDYVMPNNSLANGDLDANFFQHLPYLQEYNKSKSTNLISACAVHYEPMAIFGNGISGLDQLPQGSKIIIPADSTNQARALLLLQANGLITLKEGANLSNISILTVENSNGYNLIPVEAASIPAQLKQNGNNAIAVVNGNYAIGAGLSLSNALALESSDSDAALTYANILAINAGDENREPIKALVTLLTSQKVKDYITNSFSGAVLPV